MQVFKLYYKILNKHKGHIFMYIGIFMGILMGFIVPNMEKQAGGQFTESTTRYAVFDYDDTKISEGIKSYLSKKHEEKTISEDTAEVIQDSMYNNEVSCVVRILDGYEEAFIRGEGDAYIEVYRIPGLTKAVLFEEDLKNYIKVLDTYVSADYDLAEAMEKTQKAQETSIEVSLPTGTELNEQGIAHWFFSYQPWIFIAMFVCSLAPVLIVLQKKEVKDRIECSSYKFSKMNGEIILGAITTGLGIWAAFSVAGCLSAASEITWMQGTLYSANLLCVMMVALSITFLVSKVTEKDGVVSLLANIISLGMAFLTGVFVPMELLSDTVIKIAHFLPTFWYEKAVLQIDQYNSGSMGEILSYFGIQILFSAAILVLGLFFAKRKRMGALS